MADVFLSYASADRERVAPFAAALTARGWSVWWDRHILPGGAFEQTIDREIADALCVVVFWSRHSLESRWVRNEALEGLERHILVPVLLDDVRIPVAFRQTQTVDFRGGRPVTDPGFALLAVAVGEHVGRVPATLESHFSPPENARTTLAILPLRGDLDASLDRFIVEEVVDSIAATLSQLQGYFVLSPASTQSYIGHSTDALAIGQDLSVRYVVDGSYRHLEDEISLTIRLTDTQTRETIWRERFSATPRETTQLVERICAGVQTQLEPELIRAELTRFSRARPMDLGVWELIQKANALLRVKGWHAHVLEEAMVLLDEAVRRDPECALAHAMKSVLLGVGNRLAFWTDPSRSREAALEAADRALRIDDTDSHVLGYVGCALADYRESQRAIPILDKALEINPTNVQARMARALAYLDLGDIDQARADGQAALRLSPRDNRLAGWLVGLTALMLRSRETTTAIEYARMACRRDPQNAGAWLMLGLAQFAAGDHDEARRSLAEGHRLRPDLTFAHLRRFFGDRVAGTVRDAGLLPPSLPT